MLKVSNVNNPRIESSTGINTDRQTKKGHHMTFSSLLVCNLMQELARDQAHYKCLPAYIAPLRRRSLKWNVNNTFASDRYRSSKRHLDSCKQSADRYDRIEISYFHPSNLISYCILLNYAVPILWWCSKEFKHTQRKSRGWVRSFPLEF